MSHGRGVLVVAALVCVLGAWTGAARAQSPGVRLDSARTLVRSGEYDAATALLNPVFTDARTTAPQRSRAFLLSAAALFMKENMALSAGSRAYLQAALRADSSVRVDEGLNTDAPGIREHVETLRRELYPPDAAVRAPAVAALVVQPAMLSDTVLPVSGGLFPVAPHPSRRARAFVALTRADAPGVVFWSDTLEADSTGPLAWDLRGQDGGVVPAGRYALQVWAVDPAGERSPTVERTLEVSRIAADTQPLPPPLGQSAFAPETLRLRRGSPGAVLLGAGFGAAAAVLPAALGRTELNQGLSGDGTAYVVAASVAVAGLAGFLGGNRVRPLPENALRNAELRQQDEASRAAIRAANTQARESAPVRVRREGAGP